MKDTATSCDISISAEQAPLVSIVIPVYNVSRYLAQCLESVIHQSYHNLEIIIIDDGSTNDSGSLCDRFARSDDRIHVFHTENRGLASARNLGMEKCTGSYLLFLDSDDWIELHTVETLLNFAQKNITQKLLPQKEIWSLWEKPYIPRNKRKMYGLFTVMKS